MLKPVAKIKLLKTLYYDLNSGYMDDCKPEGRVDEDFQFFRAGSVANVYYTKEYNAEFGEDYSEDFLLIAVGNSNFVMFFKDLDELKSGSEEKRGPLDLPDYEIVEYNVEEGCA